MNNKYIIAVVVLVVVGAGIYFLTNQNPGSNTPTSNSNSTPSSASNETSTPKTTPAPVINEVVHNISIMNFAFVPSSITVRKGETIVWTNKDTTPHTVTGGDLKSNPLNQGQTYSFAYDRVGTFTYHCSIHPSMTGTVTVTN